MILIANLPTSKDILKESVETGTISKKYLQVRNIYYLQL